MKQSELEALRDQAAKVKLPQSVREAVLAEATTLDQAEQQPQSRRVTRRNFLRVGAAAAAVGVTAFLGLSILGNEDTLPVFEEDGSTVSSNSSDKNTGSTVTSSKRGFVLTAYAEGLPQEDGSVLAQGNFTILPIVNGPADGSVGTSYEPFGPSRDGNWFDICNTFIMDCTIEGDPVSITYALEGPYCEADADNISEDETGVFFYGTDAYGHRCYTSLTNPYIEDHGTALAQHVGAHFPMSDSLKEINDRYVAMEKDILWATSVRYLEFTEQNTSKNEEAFYMEDHALVRDYYFAAMTEYMSYISGLILYIAVAYTDGTVLEKRYEITLIDNFEEVYGAYLDELLEIEEKMQAEGYSEELNREWHYQQEDIPQLYTIREIEG